MLLDKKLLGDQVSGGGSNLGTQDKACRLLRYNGSQSRLPPHPRHPGKNSRGCLVPGPEGQTEQEMKSPAAPPESGHAGEER